MHRTFLMTLATCCVVGLTFGAIETASADQSKYVGGHPRGNSGYCYIEAPHVHAYAPRNAKVLYRSHDNHHYFIGDPVAHKYKGPKHAYRGHHPVPVSVVLGERGHGHDDHVEFCYLRGAHYHTYDAPAQPGFQLKGGVNWYVGPFPARYRQDRVRLARINVVYKPLRYSRPVVTVEPPFGYVEPVVEVVVPSVRGKRRRHVRARGGVEVHAGLEVHVPSVRLDVHVPGVVVVGGHRHKHKYKRRGKYKRKHKYKRRHRNRRHGHKKRRHRRH